MIIAIILKVFFHTHFLSLSLCACLYMFVCKFYAKMLVFCIFAVRWRNRNDRAMKSYSSCSSHEVYGTRNSIVPQNVHRDEMMRYPNSYKLYK